MIDPTAMNFLCHMWWASHDDADATNEGGDIDDEILHSVVIPSYA